MYQRTPIWVLPKLDLGFSPAVQRLFARVPVAQRILRWVTDTSMDLIDGDCDVEVPLLQTRQQSRGIL